MSGPKVISYAEANKRFFRDLTNTERQKFLACFVGGAAGEARTHSIQLVLFNRYIAPPLTSPPPADERSAFDTFPDDYEVN